MKAGDDFFYNFGEFSTLGEDAEAFLHGGTTDGYDFGNLDKDTINQIKGHVENDEYLRADLDAIAGDEARTDVFSDIVGDAERRVKLDPDSSRTW